VRAPKEAGLGTAMMTLSFDAWKQGKVAPATVTIPVIEKETEEKKAEEKGNLSERE
jgi:hypothetical protein